MVQRITEAELEMGDDLVYRFRGEPFTGVMYGDTPSGGYEELSFRDGYQDGPAREWYPGGQLASEDSYRESIAHGIWRTWRQDGSLSSEKAYEDAVVVWSRSYDTAGNVTETYLIDTDSREYQQVLLRRSVTGWPGVAFPDDVDPRPESP